VSVRITILLAIVTVVCGCATTDPDQREYVRGPSETAEFYLSNFYRARTVKDLYQIMAPAALDQMTFDEFVLQRQREIAIPDAGADGSVARVQAAVLKGYRVNDRHQVFYALQQVRYPYSNGRHNHYRLVRLHVVNVRNQWCVEPFVDERTATVRLLPALKRGRLRKLYDDREAIARMIAADVETVRAGETEPEQEVATDTKPLDIPDLESLVKPIPGEGEKAPHERLRTLIEVGTLHFRTGQLDLAEATFKKALDIDPLNTTAKTYLEHIRQTRQLQKEKQGMIELIERMLEAEKGRGPE